MKKTVFINLCLICAFLVSGCLVANAISNAINIEPESLSKVTVTESTMQSTLIELPTIGTIRPIQSGIEQEEMIKHDNSVPTTTMNVTTSDNEIAVFFDVAQTNRPTEADICKFEDNMTIAEVIELLGLPHSFGPTSGLISIAWQTYEGAWYYAIVIPYGAPEDISVTEAIFVYGRCMNIQQFAW